MAIRKQEIQRKMDELYSLMLREDKEFNEKCGCYEASSFCAGFAYAIGLVRGWLTLLPEDPESLRPKGEWIIAKRHTVSQNPYMDDNYHAHAICSKCGFCIHSENASFGYPELNTTNFCPNCGADMRQMEDSE